MKFTCLREKLASGLAIVSKGVPTKASLPILSNVLLTTEDGRLKLSTNNLETAITTYVGASIEAEGSITVPAKMFSEFISNLSADTVEIELKKDVLHVKAGKNSSKFNGVSATEFPPLPTINGDKTLDLEPSLFSSAVSKVVFSSAIDDTRPVLSGVLLSYDGDTLTFASTDGFRLSEKSIPLKSDTVSFSVVIPAKTILEVSRIFASSTEPVKLIINNDDNLALFESGDILLATRILDGDFPEYKKIIPSSSVLTASFDSTALLEAVKLAHIFAKEDDNVIRCAFDPSGTITVSSVSKESGENVSSLEAKVEGDRVESAFSAKYLLELLNSLKVTEIIFKSNGNLAPGVLTSPSENDYLHIIMPMRIQD
ncbi:MAG: DNA polymerase III subunit beta [Patescibacteria group bacterium]